MFISKNEKGEGNKWKIHSYLAKHNMFIGHFTCVLFVHKWQLILCTWNFVSNVRNTLKHQHTHLKPKIFAIIDNTHICLSFQRARYLWTKELETQKPRWSACMEVYYLVAWIQMFSVQTDPHGRKTSLLH